jgi:short-subunit dehydrogenase
MAYRAALVTGASSGIGESFARALPDTTALILTGRDTAALEALAKSLGRPGRDIRVVTADLATDPGRDAVIAAGEAAGIDLLVNNAGLGYFAPVPRNTIEQERAMVEVNVMTPVVLTRALLPGMIARAEKAGTRAGIIVVSSISAFLPVSRLTTYAATKAFDLHYAEALGADLEGQPCDVLALCPGFTKTKFGTRSGMKSWMFHQGADPNDVARAAIDGLGRKRVVVIGSGSIMTPLMARLLPRRWVNAAMVASMKALKKKSGL